MLTIAPGAARSEDPRPGAATLSIIAIPKGDHPYDRAFYGALERAGVRVLDGDLSGRWLLAHTRHADYVHLNWPSFLYYVPGRPWTSWAWLLRFGLSLVFLRASGVRLLWTMHNLYPHAGGRELRIHRVARALVIRLSFRVFVHGPTAAEEAIREFPALAPKLRRIRHGHFLGAYPDDLDRLEARRRLGLDPGAPVFAFVGACHPYKNLERLLEAFGKLPAESQLLIAGAFPSEPYRARIEALARPLGPRALVRAGYVPDADLQLYLKAADVAVFPYRGTLTSGAVMLALGFGRPVVAPRSSAFADAVDESCGVLYAGDGAVELAAAMRRAAATRWDPELIRRHAGSFDWDEIAARFLEALGD